MKKLLLTLSVAVIACAWTAQADDTAKPKATPDKSKDKVAVAAKSEASCCDSCCKSPRQALLTPRAAALFAKPAKNG